MPLAGKESLVASFFQHRRHSPLCLRKSASLALKSHGGHAATVGDAAGLNRCAAWCATRLCIERKERHTFARQFVNAGCGHAATWTAAIRTRVTIAKVIGHNEDNIRLFVLSLCG